MGFGDKLDSEQMMQLAFSEEQGAFRVSSDLGIPNEVEQASKSAGDIPAAYAELISLNTEAVYSHIALLNKTDQDVIVQFTENTSGSGNEITIPAETGFVFDDIIYNGKIDIKYTSIQPTTKAFYIYCW